MKIKIINGLFVILLLLFLPACSFVKEKNQATKFVDDFYSKLKNGEYESTLDMYHEKWFTVTSKNETTDFLRKIDSKLGKLDEYSVTTWNTESYVGTGGSGIYVTILYSVNRTKYHSDETLTLFKPKGEERYYILSYHVNSNGLFE